MFLTDLSKYGKQIGDEKSSEDFQAALEAVLEVAEHTNTMMWIGEMKSCPFPLCGQGPLLYHGGVMVKKVHDSFKHITKNVSCLMILFQQTLVLCKILDASCRPALEYLKHIK